MNTGHFCFRKPITKLVHIRQVLPIFLTTSLSVSNILHALTHKGENPNINKRKLVVLVVKSNWRQSSHIPLWQNQSLSIKAGNSFNIMCFFSFLQDEERITKLVALTKPADLSSLQRYCIKPKLSYL